MSRIPRRLYKYRAFSSRALDLLISDQIYFSDPSSFNDPLDTKPGIELDLDTPELEWVLSELYQRRLSEELKAAANNLRYSGPKTVEHIKKLVSQGASSLLSGVEHRSSNPFWGPEDIKRYLLDITIREELLGRYDKGVFSLASRCECPLMWSHYGDQHRGICIGYSVPSEISRSVYRIKYGGNRLVKASDVKAMLEGRQAAQARVDEAVLLRKAEDWKYEREWRLLGAKGIQESPLEMEEVVFGLRCSEEVKFSIVRALDGRCRNLKFYEIINNGNDFSLNITEVDLETWSDFPHRSLNGDEMAKKFDEEMD
ncbi:DUF2971 domain-containing protein [Radicibacter daui]|uniref:DUF2971 domain-containing protein n=1 Tax=Radicibacter daui TaxID=3064829 RepID=UPI0040468B37